MRYTYYCVKDNSAWQLDWHNSLPLHKSTNSQHLPRLMRESDQIWVQGPRGGVQLIKDAYWNYWTTYVRRNSEQMKQFTWVKLRAKELKQS